ncbi:unnamed protein product [Haemonchus placei]|uniref:GPI alpha-1,4-mannosyltransferase I, catalytic subunit n=1 Tax=Haemonchus placei TaxID=6290 RepID=A0A158QPL4_HAEPC|nr:unnamed protein product [Haemonchus placei]
MVLFFQILFVALAARFTLVMYSNIHDYIFQVNFTDIDYSVYSDAAKHVAAGRSPFERETYRYTPALAWILLPNNSYRDFGMFSENICSLFLTSSLGEDWIIQSVVAFWLANPLTAVISARGSADVLVCAAVLFTLHLLRKDQWVAAAIVHGALAIHLKIYPVIYLPSIFLHLCQFSASPCIFASMKQLLINWKGFAYALISLGCFGAIVAFFYLIYGDLFLEEFLLYHIKRRDVAHNFSPYFYVSLLFYPRWVSFCIIYHHDLPFCWFMSTFAFVTFNKVCTSQYFVWYICLLPLLRFQKTMPMKEVISLIGIWFTSQGVWLLFAYLYEFRKWRTLEFVWMASIAFLVVNCYIMTKLSRRYWEIRRTPTKLKIT